MSSLLKHKRAKAQKDSGDQPRESPRLRDNLISPRNFALIQQATTDNVVSVVDDDLSDENSKSDKSTDSDDDMHSSDDEDN